MLASYTDNIITETCPTFSAEEQKKFQTRLENGYNLKTDLRYNIWLSIQGVDHAAGKDVTQSITLVSNETCDSDDNKCKYKQ